MAASADSTYPPVSFYFLVEFPDISGAETSFQEVSGIKTELNTEDVEEGGENRFKHRLPTSTSHSNLVLKRGLTSLSSPLVTWVKGILEGDFTNPIVPKSVNVKLLNEEGSPLMMWSFVNAIPVKWEVSDFGSLENKVAIETLELSFNYSTRTK